MMACKTYMLQAQPLLSARVPSYDGDTDGLSSIVQSNASVAVCVWSHCMQGCGLATNRLCLHVQAGDIVLAILGNKIDLPPRERSVPEDEACSFAESIGAAHHDVSAKTGAGIEAAVTGTIRRALAAAHVRPPDAGAGA